LGVAQLRGLDRRMTRRHAINAAYRAGLGDVEGVSFMPRASYGEPNDWLTCIEIEATACSVTPEDIRLALEEHDIESRPTWKPLHLQELFRGAPTVGGDVAAAIFSRGLCLPSGSNLSDGDQERVIDLIRRRVDAA
jgi:dTDP-4-amino-4,6-dideoxygalactose transaminase